MMKLLKFALCFSLLVSTLVAKQPSASIGISNYLKMKYLGATITFEDSADEKLLKKLKKLEKKKRKKKKKNLDRLQKEQLPNKGDVMAVLVEKESYSVLLEDGRKIRVMFTVSRTGDPAISREFMNKSHNMQMQVLRATEFVNASIASIGSEGSVSAKTFSSQFDSMKDNPQMQDNFATREKIIYTDKRVDKRKTGMAFVSMDGIFLDNGSPVEVAFERVDYGEN